MKNWTQVPAGDINNVTQRIWSAIGDQAEVVVNRVKEDPMFAVRVAQFMIGGGFEPSTSQKLAREIMGRNFFGVEEAIKHFGVNPSKQQLAFLAEIPWSEEVLRACKDTHVLIATFALSVLDIRGIVKKLADQTLFYGQDWYDKQAFAVDKGEIGWQLVRKVPVADSTNKTWNEQQALLSKDEETPKARVVIQTAIGHFLATGERLFEKIYVRCVDLYLDGRRVCVGYFVARGLHVYYCWDGSRDDSIGVSAARKQ